MKDKRKDKDGHEHDHDHSHGHDHAHGHGHEHHHDRKTRFHDPEHAAEYDRRSATAGIRGDLTAKLMDMMSFNGSQLILDLATGTGRVARPVSKRLQAGRIIGVDQAKAMLDIGHGHEHPISSYSQVAAGADALPLKPHIFDQAFVSFSLHHFDNAPDAIREVLRVLKNGGKFFVLDPVIHEAQDAVDMALEAKINQVFRRTHGESFRFHTASSIQRLLTKAGFSIARSNILTYPFDQEGMEGVPTGHHWLEAAEELETEAPQLAERIKQRYFSWHKHGDAVHVTGSFSYALIRADRPV